MPFRLINESEMPPGGFRFFIATTGKWIPEGRDPFTCKIDLVSAVKQHYKANHIQIPNNLNEAIDEQVCQSLPPGWCENEHHQPSRGWVLPFDFQKVKQFTGTLVSWWRDNGLAPVSIEEIKTRADICGLCQFNRDPDGCSSCNKPSFLESAQEHIVGTRGPWDNQLKACSVCGCLLQLKVRIPTAIILKHMPQEQQERLPAHCWLKSGASK